MISQDALRTAYLNALRQFADKPKDLSLSIQGIQLEALLAILECLERLERRQL